MALILSAATGNFSTGSTWVGGIVPGPADEARASTGHTVTINQSVTVTTISISGTGIFQLSNGVTLTANISASGTPTGSVAFGLISPATATIIGNLNGGVGANSLAIETTIGSSGTLNVIGNCNNKAIIHRGSGILNVYGNLSSSAGSGSTDTIVVTTTGILNLYGNATAGIASNRSIVVTSNGIVNVIGNVTGGSGDVGIVNSSTGNVNITGNVIAGNASAVQSILGGTLRVSGSIISAIDGRLAVYATKMLCSPQPALAKTRYALSGSGTYVDMFTADNNLGQANPTDVRIGTVYASGNLTGTCAVPAAGSVALGVPVDATTGTAVLTAADVRAAIGMASANLDTQLAAIPTAITNAAAVRTNLATELGRIDATISSRSTLTSANVRTELTPELTEITEVHAIHGLDIANALTVTPTSRTSGAITQSITGDGTTNTVVTRV